MSISGLLLFVVFLLGAVAVIVWPLIQQPEESAERHKTALSTLARLQAEHESILVGVRDLDFDYQTGKLAEDDYLAQRENLMMRGVEILKQIDAQESEAIEAAIRAKRDVQPHKS